MIVQLQLGPVVGAVAGARREEDLSMSQGQNAWDSGAHVVVAHSGHTLAALGARSGHTLGA